MSRYIKFDDAVKIMACEMYAEAQSQGYDVDGIEDFMPEAKAWITDAPSIDIVFCKECRHWYRAIDESGTIEYFNFSRCTKGRGGNGLEFYCADGERREP